MSTMGSTNEVLLEVLQERLAQDAKWGQQDHDNTVWSTVLTEEVGEAAQAVMEQRFNPCSQNVDRLRMELLQVAAVAVNWVEAIDRQRLSATR